ncbi:hypothetical protein GUITHDRAFT_85675 [Guillardia theta CCMP2712]|uniref:Glutathione peroxidase n=1 Tax=Guillardia theta (strain CCMP2712) TaxID=905079 RepID=L1JM99_GUITC|nr:hypothetical protein GUITHDRAFT_85675 [Guillardia theta CCMP2712]EKX49726.1 hypothetical protein GUITHDRAFT_85675 [Guillardia theta CCMP2712]|mmetsp:Transcript_29776/g.95251  ORF Transcript_29776/g.95251 Transcript_29776/m.95251 type:complete len:261 (+) Transcript_29776:420-1202(+)|eukprot:XP_005836706.1 hypothetical protein GUITHDRAFT_85675 [Guillardia theta CCMP2712]
MHGSSKKKHIPANGPMRCTGRGGVILVVLLAFPTLVFVAFMQSPYEEDRKPSPSPQGGIALSKIQKYNEESQKLTLPHKPYQIARQSFTEKAADAVAGLVTGKPHSIYDFKARSIDGEEVSLSKYSGKVVIIVNLASNCGYTDVNYRELQTLYSKYQKQGLTVLGFPCNQFGGQEPGSDEEIKKFAESKYHVSFPLFSKVEVNGKYAHPLFSYLKDTFGMKSIPWNFQKFVVDRNGQPVLQYPSQIDPMAMEGEILKLIG